MLRCLVVLIGLLATSGCITWAGEPSLHPHSEIMEPTFCLHGGAGDVEPRAITRIAVVRDEKVNDERIEWVESGPPVWYRLWRGGDQLAWVLEYAPDDSASLVKTFSCITYGKAPPGYKEKSPALPLTPERLYRVKVETEDAQVGAGMFFIIRLDSVGRPVKLEYAPAHGGAYKVQVITQR